MTTDTNRASAEAMPKSITGFDYFGHHPSTPSAITHRLARSAVESMSMENLLSLFQAVSLAVEALQGIVCQPRFNSEKSGEANPAGDVVEDMITHLFECRSLILDVADKAVVTDPQQAEYRAWLLLQYQIRCTDGLAELSALAAKLVAVQSSVEFQDRHARGEL